MDAVVDASPAPQAEPLHALCTFYTWLLLALTLIEFFTGMAAPEHIMSTLYFAFATAYAGHREAGKWSDPQAEAYQTQRKGERFVLVWGLMLLVTWIAATYIPSFELGDIRVVLHYPHELPAIVLEVVGIFTGTNISKHYREAAAAATVETKKDDSNGAANKERTATKLTLLKHAVMIMLPDEKDLRTQEILALFSGGLEKVASRTLERALDELTAEDLLEKISKGPHDSNTRYRRKKPFIDLFSEDAKPDAS